MPHESATTPTSYRTLQFVLKGNTTGHYDMELPTMWPLPQINDWTLPNELPTMWPLPGRSRLGWTNKCYHVTEEGRHSAEGGS